MTRRPLDDAPKGPAAQPQLGERIRALRSAHGYTLARLAAAAGVSPSFLSMLETGKTNVAAPRLQAIAEVFDLGASDLLPDVTGDSILHVVRAGRRPAVPGLSDGVRGAFLARDLHRKIQPVVLTLAPGSRHANESGHAGEELVFVLRGRLRVVVGEQEAVLEAGDAASYPSALRHVYENVGEEPAEVLTVSAPPKVV